MPVHMCGAQAHVEELTEICKRHNLILIEDTCQAMGATYKGKHLGTFGQLGCFSYDFVKVVTMGEGGAVVTDDDQLARKADGYVDHGHDHIGNDRGAETHPFMGVNYRVSELSSAIGLAQMRKLDKIVARQKEIKKYIKDALKESFVPVFLVRKSGPGRKSIRGIQKSGIGRIFPLLQQQLALHPPLVPPERTRDIVPSA